MLRELKYPYSLHLVNPYSVEYFDHLRGLGVKNGVVLSEELITSVFAPLNEQLFGYLSRARQVYRDAGLKVIDLQQEFANNLSRARQVYIEMQAL